MIILFLNFNKSVHYYRLSKERYPGDIHSSDFSSPKKQKISKLKEDLDRKKKQLKLLQQSNRRLKMRIQDLKSLASHLKQKNLISTNSQEVLVSITTLATHLYIHIMKFN